MMKIILSLLFAASLVETISAQKSWHFVTAKTVVYAKVRNKNLEKALHKWNENATADGLRYHYNEVDLNDDGKLDAIVLVSGEAVCGTGGCEVLIFKGDGANYSLMTEMSVSHSPIFVAATRTKGWRDLVMEVYGGGIKPYFAVLKFDGKTYPENPTDQPAFPKRSRAKFVEYLSGIEDIETGFEFK